MPLEHAVEAQTPITSTTAVLVPQAIVEAETQQLWLIKPCNGKIRIVAKFKQDPSNLENFDFFTIQKGKTWIIADIQKNR